MANFPPLFPNSKFLRKQTWHKVIFLLSWIYSASALYSLFAGLIYLLSLFGLLTLDFGSSIMLSVPMIPVLLPLQLFSYKQLSTLPSTGDNLFSGPEFGLIVLMVYFLVSVFLPSLIYTVLLNGFLGSKWKKSFTP